VTDPAITPPRAHRAAKRYIYAWGDGPAEGDGTMKVLLGEDGAALAEMANAGVPTPPGFTITTDSEANQAGRHRAVETDEEAWAFDILRRHLAALGHAIDNVRQPDKTNRSSRDVDFLLEIDGREVAIEVTRFDQERQWWVLLERLHATVLAELGDWPPLATGLTMELKLLRTGSYSDIDRAGQAVAALARKWGQDPRASKSRVASDLVEVELSPRNSPGLMILRRTGAHDPRLDPRAFAFVQQLVQSKKGQGANYAELWLLVIDMELIIGLDLIEAAFAESAAEVPWNWARLYLLPAEDRNDVQCLTLRT